MLTAPLRWSTLLLLMTCAACGGPPIDKLTSGQPLLNAAVHWDTKRIGSLLSSGVDVNLRDQRGWTALHWASGWMASHSKDQVASLRILLANGANVNARGNAGETPLALGAWSADCVRILLGAGAHVNVADKQGKTPLMEAAWQGTDEAVILLLNAGAEPNVHENGIDWPPLMYAVIHRGPEAVRALLKAGARVNDRDQLGHTALNKATTAKLPDSLDRLMHDADRRYVLERKEIAQILKSAGGVQ